MLDWDAPETTRELDRDYLALYLKLAEKHWADCRSQFARGLIIKLREELKHADAPRDRPEPPQLDP